MQRRGFIGALIALAVGSTAGKLASAEQKTDMAGFMPQMVDDVNARLTKHGDLLIQWGRPQMRVFHSKLYGHVDRIWFEQETEETAPVNGWRTSRLTGRKVVKAVISRAQS